MSESAQMQRIVVALGIVAAFTVLMYAGLGIAGGPPSIAAITYPTFNNPFAPRTATFVVSSEGPNTGPPRGTSHGDGSDVNCVTGFTNSGGTTWGCVREKDELKNYVSIQTLGIYDRFSENITGPGFTVGKYQIISMTLEAECTSEDATRPIEFNFAKAGVPVLSIAAFPNPADTTKRDKNFICPAPIGAFANVTMTLTSDTGVLSVDPASLEQSTMGVAYDSSLGAKIAWVSEMHVTITYQRSSGCVFTPSGNPWDDVSRATYYVGCVLSAVGQFLSDAIAFVVNVIIFIGEWLGAFVSIIASVFGIIAWLYAIPGMPAPIQVFIDAALTGMALVLVYNVVKTLRGSQG